MSELTLALFRIAILALLWLFVLAALRVIRADLFGSGRTVAPAGRAAAVRPAPPPAGSPRRSAARRVRVVAGPDAGRELPLGDAPVTIGRSETCTLPLRDDYASNEHARLVPGGDRWLVEDLGSTNGTYVDRQRVLAPTAVPLGVPIRVGASTLELAR